MSWKDFPCEISPLGKNSSGYAHIYVQRKAIGHHRYVYSKYHNITLTSEIHVLHHCDNRGCIQIEHLFLGTNQDNIEDRVSKDRSKTRLSKELRQEVRDMYDAGCYTQTELATLYDVGVTIIHNIVTGKYKRG